MMAGKMPFDGIRAVSPMSDTESAPDQILAASDHAIFIRSSGDVSDALGACFGARGLILTEDALSKEFFELGTGLAGELFQKFVNYRIPLAVVIEDFSAHGVRFSELAREHAAHGAVRFVHSTGEARAWLESLPRHEMLFS